MKRFSLFLISLVTMVWGAHTALAINAASLIPKVELFFSPSNATFIEGSTFDVPVYVNTKGTSFNTIDLKINFDPRRMTVIQPTAGKSIIGLWLETPNYDNTKGVIRIVGSIPNGINTSSGLIITMSFKALNPGTAVISVDGTTKIFSNDGVGTPVEFTSNRASYKIIPRPPDGVTVFSETHPFEDNWYNNPNPVFSWDSDPELTGYSYGLDTIPTTVPDNVSDGVTTAKSYENLADGLWYFHLKALRKGVWGTTTHRLVRIDRTPPAEFTPTVNYLSAAAVNKLLVSFFTTDSLSGLDHYEVGIINHSDDPNISPVFVQAESPFQLPFGTEDKAHIIVRAFDRAGNIREEKIDAEVPDSLLNFLERHMLVFVIAVLAFIILLFVFHHLFGRHVVRKIGRGFQSRKEPYMPPPPQFQSRPVPPPFITSPPTVSSPQQVDKNSGTQVQ